jgi:membrane protease YdiL (CAAX protease family)
MSYGKRLAFGEQEKSDLKATALLDAGTNNFFEYRNDPSVEAHRLALELDHSSLRLRHPLTEAFGAIALHSGTAKSEISIVAAIRIDDHGHDTWPVYRLFMVREYDEAFSQLSETYPSTTDRLLLVFAFLKHAIPPAMIVLTVLLMSANRRLAVMFCHTYEKEKIFQTLKAMTIVFVAFFLLPHLGFNPFSTDYLKKVCVSMYLHDTDIRPLSVRITLMALYFVIIPVYLMNRAGVSIKSLLTIDMARLRNAYKTIMIGTLGLLLYVLLIVTVYLLGGPLNAPILEGFRDNSERFKLFVVVIGPVMEEICHRGMVLSLLQRHFKAYIGIILSALFFVSFHYHLSSSFSIAVIFGSGIVLALFVERTQSLWPAFILHIAFNSRILLL